MEGLHNSQEVLAQDSSTQNMFLGRFDAKLDAKFT